MAVFISDTCICCGACIDECPVEAIVDEDDNPTGRDTYYVYPDKCVECVGHYNAPACAQACPTDGCFVWDMVHPGQPFRKEISDEIRATKTKPVVE